MPGTVSTSGRRKVRCPKCTACLTEPPIPIYQCPICSTLLLAKGSAGDPRSESFPGSGVDAESTQRILEDALSKPENELVICENNKTVETSQSILVGRSQQENAHDIDDPSKKQEQQGMELIADEIRPFNAEDESKQDSCAVHDYVSSKQLLQGVDNVGKERTSLEADGRRSHTPPVDDNASESCGELRDSNVKSVQQIIERWSKLEKDARVYETKNPPKSGGRNYMKIESETTDGIEGHDFEFDTTDSCDAATEDVEEGIIERETQSIRQTPDGPDKDADRMLTTLGGLSEREHASVRCDPSQKPGKERVSLEGDGIDKQENAALIDDPKNKQQHQVRDCRGVELESSSAGKGSLDDSHATSTENFLHGSCTDAESIKQIRQQWSKLENGALIEEPRNKHSHQRMKFVEEGSAKPESIESCEFQVHAINNNDSLQQSCKNGGIGRDTESEGMLEPNMESEIEGHAFEFNVIDNNETAPQRLVSGLYGRDTEMIQQTCKGRSDPIENVEVRQHTQVGGCNQENAAVNCPRKTKVQLGIDYMEECKSTNKWDGESTDENVSKVTDFSKKQEKQGIDYMEKDAVISEPSNEQNLENERAESDVVVGLTDSCEATRELLSGHNGRDPESTYNTLAKGSKQNKDSGIIHETMDEGGQEENATAINHPVEKKQQLGLDFSKKQEQQGINYMEKDAVISEPSNEQNLESERAESDVVVGLTDSCEATSELLSGHNGRDPESTYNTLAKGSKHNKDSGIIHETMDEGGQEENATAINHPVEKKQQLGLDHMEVELKSFGEEGGPMQENVTVINNPREKQGVWEMDCVEKKHESLEEVRESKQEDASAINGPTEKHGQKGVDYMEKEGGYFEGPNKCLHILKDPEMSECMSNVEKDAVMNELNKGERQQGVMDIEKLSAIPYGVEWQDVASDGTGDCEAPQHVESSHMGRDAESVCQESKGECKPEKEQDMLDSGSKKENASAIDDSDRKQRQGMDDLEMECKSFNKDNILLHHSRAKESPDDSNNRSTKNSGYENFFGSQCIKSESAIDRDSIINDLQQGMKCMEAESVLSHRIKVPDFDLGLIDYGEATQIEMSGYTGREFSGALLHEEDTDKEVSVMMKESDLDRGSTDNTQAETTNISESSVLPEAVTPSIMDSLGDPGDPISDKDPSEVAHGSHIDKLCGSLTKSALSVSKSKGASIATNPEAVCVNEITRETSKQPKQQLHGGNVVDAVSVDEDGEGNYRKQGSAALRSHLMDVPRDSNLEANSRYADVWTEKLGITEGLDRLDMSLCDWQSLKASKACEDLKENGRDAGLLDERSVLNSDTVFLGASASTGCEDASFATLKGENSMLKQGFSSDDTSVIQSEALSDLNNTDSSSSKSCTEGKVPIEKSTIPIRTAAMQKFLQRTGKEVTDQMQLPYQESEVKVYNAPYIEEYKPGALLSTADNVNQSTKGKLAAFNNEQMDASNDLLAAGSNILAMDRKPDSPSSSEAVETPNHSMLREDWHSELGLNLNLTKEEEGATLQKTALSEHDALSNISTSNMFGSGQWPRSDQHHESKIASSQRSQMNDHQAKHFERSSHQTLKTGDGVDLCKAVLNRNVKADDKSRLMNAVPFEQVDHAQASLQEHNSLAYSQKYETDNGVMDQGSSYLLHGPADGICSHSERRSQESSPCFSSAANYLSNARGLSPLSVANRPYSFEAPSQTSMSPVTMQEHAFSHLAHHSVSPVCTVFIQQAHSQQPQLPQNMMQHHCAVCFPQISSMANQQLFYDGWESAQAHHMQSLPHSPSDRLCQAGSVSPPARMFTKSNFESRFRPLLPGRHRHFPPLPREGAVPYVLCQECDQLLLVPQYFPPNGGNTQKLRCGACGKISKFSIYQEPSIGRRIESSQSSNVSLEINSKIRTSITPSLVQSSSACKIHPEASIVQPSGYSSSFSSNDRGGRLLIPKAAQRVESPRYQRVESPHHDIAGGRTAVGSSHYDIVDDPMLHQTDSSGRIISTGQGFNNMHRPRSIGGTMQDQEFSGRRSRDGQGDRFLNTRGTNSRSNLSSFPPSVHGSSVLGNISNICVEDDLKERAPLGGKKISNSFYLHHSVNDQDGRAFELSDSPNNFFWKGYNKSKNNAVTMEDSHHMHSTESVDNEPLGRNQLTWRESSAPWHVVGPSHSRSSSKGDTAQFRKWSTAPGSPLIEHFNGESMEFGPTVLQRVSYNGSGSAPWTRGSVSPVYDSVVYDSSFDHKEHDFSRKPHGAVAQDTSRRSNYFAGLLKKSFKDIGKGGQGNNNSRKVMVNGKLIPDAVVKKAEEKAGVIYPGSYWYDYQAGFWGVIGGPCLGIIPPFIEEMNFPLAKDCAGGQTGILVNGRELHHKDLQLLAGRGLPTTPGKAYAIDILGNVVDDASGQQLGTLGKLAPTIERKKSGYGMFQPSYVQSG